VSPDIRCVSFLLFGQAVEAFDTFIMKLSTKHEFIVQPKILLENLV